MAAGKQVKWGQLVGMAVLAGAAVSAQAASSKAAAHSQGSANASANGQANASGSSVLNGGTATAPTTATSTSNGNGNGNGNGKSNSSSSSGSGNSSSNASGAGASNSASGSSSGSSSSTAGNASGNANSTGSSSSSSGSASAGSSSSAPTSTGTVVTSAGSASGAAAASTTPGGITYGVDGFNNLAAANAFYGLVGGNDNAGINGLDTSWGGGWTLAAKDNTDSGDDVANRVLGIAFSVDAGAKASAGHWSLSGSGLSSGTMLLDVVAVLKSSTQYGLYYFHDVVFDGAVGGDWLSPSFNANGVRQDLSHLSIYVRPGSELPTLSQPQGGPSNTASGGLAVPRAVPEPGTLALMSMALLALAVIRRKATRRG